MTELTFAEQVKIILKRKNMTIKALADLIEERTGKKMSRQNLTQRLGRDNFQEQDMRLIASILGCDFRMDILGGIKDGEDVQTAQPKIKRLSTIEKKKPGLAIEVEEVTGVDEEHTREVTVGELADINEEVDKLLAESDITVEIEAKQPEKPVINEIIKEELQERLDEVHENPDNDSSLNEEDNNNQSLSSEEIETLLHEVEEEEIVHEESIEHKEVQHEKQGGFRSIFSRFTRKHDEPADVKGAQELSTENIEEFEEDEEVVTQVSADEFLEKVHETQHENAGEAAPAPEEAGTPDINPYTGLEYETNSVRVHPNKIGYVQVYDRRLHKWTEMTEWAFLGYQERQKMLLGKEYREPTYLD